MLFELITGHSMRDRDNVKTCMTSTSNVVRGITNDNRPTRIERSAVLSGEPFDNDGGKLEPVTRVIAERADAEIQVSVQARYAKLDFGCYTQISGQDSLHEPVFVQRGNGIKRTGIRWLLTGEFLFPLEHHTGQYLVKPLDALFGNFRLHARSDSCIHNNRLVGVAMHTRLREDDRLLLKTICAGDTPSEPTQVSRYQGAVNIPDDQTRVSRTHTEHSGMRSV